MENSEVAIGIPYKSEEERSLICLQQCLRVEVLGDCIGSILGEKGRRSAQLLDELIQC